MEGKKICYAWLDLRCLQNKGGLQALHNWDKHTSATANWVKDFINERKIYGIEMFLFHPKK